MKVPTHHNSETVSMANNTTKGPYSNSSMDKMRKMLSPGTKKKLSGGGYKTFGVPLCELVQQAPHGYKVPYIVKKICSFIEHHGLDHEGVFRVNGSQRVVEKLRASFDLHGDANLDEDNDMMAVAGLLKMFLRELPESTIPEHMTRRFVAIQEKHQRSAGELVGQLKVLLRDLPDEHYDLLKHIVRFLAIIACNEPVNKMSPMALAIVFGPNLFRCGKGFVALKDQGTTNQVVYRFITDYNSLFKDTTEDPPAVYWEMKKNNLVPPRPPPPAFPVVEVVEPGVRPVPSPRKSKMKNHDGSVEFEDQDHSESSISSKGRNSHSYNSPSFSDEEMTGRLSPFHLDSDSGFSLVESPVPSARTSEFVDKAIKATVIGHLFGDESSLLNASIDTTIRDDQSALVTDSQEMAGGSYDIESTEAEVSGGVKERVAMFEGPSTQSQESLIKPAKQRPTSKAFEAFESKGMIITQMHSMHAPINHTDVDGEEEEEETEGDGFEGVRRNSDPLQNFKRPAGPQNRRGPSRRLRQNSGETEERMDQEQEDIEVIPNGYMLDKPDNDALCKADDGEGKPDRLAGGDAKSRIAFLDVQRQDDAQGSSSPDKSPTSTWKPFVPPLDFSTLHESVGSKDAIPAQTAQQMAYQRAKPHMLTETEEEVEKDSQSPRLNKVKRKAGMAVEEEDLPPFSQVDQDLYKLHSHGSTDDELTAKMKSQMRKIQGLKKKMKHFEEVFENEHGYKPSHAEKASKPEIKKCMMELSRARKEAKRLKEEAEMGSRSRHGSGASSTGERMDPPDLPPTMSQTLDIILKRLKEKRKESQRPEDIELMGSDQVQSEKLAVQKALLHFEGVHGRPKTKDEKDLMRPLYDRYRTIKRLLSRQPMSPRGNLELETVPEDRPIDINSQTKFGEDIMVEPIRVPTAMMDNNDEDDEPLAPLGTIDFAVTRDLSILKSRPVSVEDQGPHSPKARRKLDLRENIENRNTSDSNLHELSVPELQDVLLKSRNIKKRLRKTLRDYEENFARRTGRKVGRDDRIPMQAEYNEYKQIKSKLKLLEALLSKHHLSNV